MNDKNIDSKSESILLSRAREFKVADERAFNKQTFAGVGR